MEETRTTAGTLNQEDIAELLDQEPPLVENAPDLKTQLQPNGLDLTLASVARFDGPGKIPRGGGRALLPATTDMPFDEWGNTKLEHGSYLVSFTETVNVPNDIMALARSRSSLLRAGCTIHTGVWDAGYKGRSQALLTVENKFGITLEKGARIVQMIFWRMSGAPAKPYDGRYQGEGLQVHRTDAGRA